MGRFGKPDIFNTDQSTQFTSVVFTGRLLADGVKVSMDGGKVFFDPMASWMLPRD